LDLLWQYALAVKKCCQPWQHHWLDKPSIRSGFWEHSLFFLHWRGHHQWCSMDMKAGITCHVMNAPSSNKLYPVQACELIADFWIWFYKHGWALKYRQFPFAGFCWPTKCALQRAPKKWPSDMWGSWGH